MVNKYDEKYEIRLAKYEEIPEVMDFIDQNWKKGHILAKNRSFFEYEMVVDGNVNFLIAKTWKDGSIEGILGYKPCSRRNDKLDIWGVIWKTIEGATPMLGMELKKRLMEITGARTDLGVGANVGTSIPLLSRIYHYYTAKMQHYYRLADCTEYKIAKVVNKKIPQYKQKNPTQIIQLRTIQDFKIFYNFSEIEDMIPYKDLWYYQKRFYEHPIYKYELWGLSNKNGDTAVIVTRKQEYKGKTAVRIVDYIGKQKLFSGCGDFLNDLLTGSEYIDFYFDGFDEQYALDAGMTKVEQEDENIIPNYFAPFEQINVDIYVDSSDTEHTCTFFLADGDQDRPN